MSETTPRPARADNAHLPALKTRKALSRAAPGAVLVVSCTDPMAVIDIPHLVGQTGDAIEAQDKQGERRRSGSPSSSASARRGAA